MNMLYISKVVKGFKFLSLKRQNEKNKFFVIDFYIFYQLNASAINV